MNGCVMLKGYVPFCSEEPHDQSRDMCEYFMSDTYSYRRLDDACRHFVTNTRECTCKAAINEATLMRKLENL